MSDRWAVHHGDCREVMQAMEPESIDSIVSDPPYGLSLGMGGHDVRDVVQQRGDVAGHARVPGVRMHDRGRPLGTGCGVRHPQIA